MNIFTKLFTRQPKYNGIAPDIRSQAEKEKDWKAEEVFAPQPPKFRTVFEGQWKKYQIRNQDGSGSCVANTVAKMLEIKRFLAHGDSVKFSHAPIYINRVNKPNGGMVGQDALQLAVKFSSCKEVEMPSENMTDAQLDALRLPANFEALNNLVKPTNYVVLPNDFDYVASMIEQEGCAMIWVDTGFSQWGRDIPLKGGKGGGVRHSITGVDTITLDGVQYIVIEDSWGKFGKYSGQRLLSREFFKDAVFFCAVLTNFQYNVVDNQRFAPFNTYLEFGDRNGEVKRLQEYLQTKGFFPANTPTTGYYGAVTAKAVYTYQVKFNVATLAELDMLGGKRVGKKTLAVINNNL